MLAWLIPTAFLIWFLSGRTALFFMRLDDMTKDAVGNTSGRWNTRKPESRVAAYTLGPFSLLFGFIALMEIYAVLRMALGTRSN